MAFRFFRRMKIAPGVTLNFSKSGISTSFGVRGAKVTVGPRGVRRTVGLPGTGLFYTETGSGAGGKRRSKRQSQPRGETAPPPPANKLDLGFFDSLLTPKGERAFVEGCKAYIEGKPQKAISELQTATHLADGAFLAGFLTIGETVTWQPRER